MSASPHKRLSLTQRATFNNAWMGQQDLTKVNLNFDRVIKYQSRDPMKTNAFYSNDVKVFNQGNNSSFQSISHNQTFENVELQPQLDDSPKNHQNPPLTSRGNLTTRASDNFKSPSNDKNFQNDIQSQLQKIHGRGQAKQLHSNHGKNLQAGANRRPQTQGIGSLTARTNQNRNMMVINQKQEEEHHMSESVLNKGKGSQVRFTLDTNQGPEQSPQRVSQTPISFGQPAPISFNAGNQQLLTHVTTQGPQVMQKPSLKQQEAKIHSGTTQIMKNSEHLELNKQASSGSQGNQPTKQFGRQQTYKATADQASEIQHLNTNLTDLMSQNDRTDFDDIIDEEGEEDVSEKKKKKKVYVPLAERESPTIFLRRFLRKRNKELDISEKFKKLDQDLQDLTEKLRERPTEKNILKIKEDLIALKKISEGTHNTVISHSQLAKESKIMANKVISTNYLVQKHRLINSYVDSYKLKLCLKDSQDPLEAMKNKETTLTIDFNELQRFELASANTGFDQFQAYFQQKEDKLAEIQLKVSPIVDTGMQELNAAKEGKVLDKSQIIKKISVGERNRRKKDEEAEDDEQRAAQANRFYDHQKAFQKLIDQNKEINRSLKEVNPALMSRIQNTKLDESYEMFQKAFDPPRKIFSPPITVRSRKNSQLLPIFPTGQRKMSEIDDTKSKLSTMWNSLRSFKQSSSEISHNYGSALHNLKNDFENNLQLYGETEKLIKQEQKFIQKQKQQKKHEEKEKQEAIERQLRIARKMASVAAKNSLIKTVTQAKVEQKELGDKDTVQKLMSLESQLKKAV